MKLGSLPGRRIASLVLPSLILTALVAFDVIPLLRGGFGWRWPYEPVLDLRRSGPLALAVCIYVPVALRLLRRRNVRGLLAWAVAGSLGLTLAAVHLRDDILYRLFSVTGSGIDGGWHMAAAQIDNLGDTLRHWPAFMADSVRFSTHMGISPPGMVVFYYAANSLLAHLPTLVQTLARPLREWQCGSFALMWQTNAQLASAWLGMLTPVWSSLTILPLYHQVRRVFGAEPARWSVLWWPLIPSYLLFAPLPNTLYPLLSIVMISLLLEGLRRNQARWVIAAGLLMSLLTFLTFTFMPLLLLAGLLTLGFFWIKRLDAGLPWHWPIRIGLYYGLGLSIVWLLFYALVGLNPWAIWQAATQAHVALDRPYLPWLILHLHDYFMFTGWPLTILAGIGVWAAVRKLRARERLGESDIVILAAALTLLLLDLSGMLRGESGRILLFLSPWLLPAAACALNRDRRLGGVSTVTQAVVAVALIVSLRVLDPEFAYPPSTPPYVAEPAAGAQVLPSGAVFGQGARLQAFAGTIETRTDVEGNEQPVLVLWLEWETLGRMDTPWYMSLLPVAPDGEVATAALVRQPFGNEYPMTCWKCSDGALRDRVEVPLFKSQPGDWWVSFSLINGQTGQTLEVIAPDGSRDRQVGLGGFKLLQ